MLKQGWLNYFPFFLLGLLVISFLATHDPNIDYDTPSYINFEAIRPLLYPTFIWLFHYHYNLIMWVHAIFLWGALWYARSWLKQNLQVSDSAIFFIFLSTLFTISFHYQIVFIQSEGITFPLFIVTFFFLIECFQKFNLKKLIYLSALVSLLVLTRLQFYYFYAIFLLLCIWYLWQGIPPKQLLKTISIFFGSILFTFLVDYSYHYFKHGFFGEAPYSAILVLTQPLYLADDQASNYFQNAEQKNVMQSLLNERNRKHLNDNANLVGSSMLNSLTLAYKSYYRNFYSLHITIDKILNKKYQDQLEQNAKAQEINKILIAHETKNNLIFFIWKIIQFTGGIPLFIFYVILICSFIFKIIKDKHQLISFPIIFVGLSSIITILNSIVIAICNIDLPGYFCYSQFIFYCLAGFLVNQIFPRNNSTIL